MGAPAGLSAARVRFRPYTAAPIDWIHAEGIGHHWMAGCGHVGAEIRAWAKVAGPTLRLADPPTGR